MPLEENDAGYLWDMLEAARGVAASLQDLAMERYQADDRSDVDLLAVCPVAGRKHDLGLD